MKKIWGFALRWHASSGSHVALSQHLLSFLCLYPSFVFCISCSLFSICYNLIVLDVVSQHYTKKLAGKSIYEGTYFASRERKLKLNQLINQPEFWSSKIFPRP